MTTPPVKLGGRIELILEKYGLNDGVLIEDARDQILDLIRKRDWKVLDRARINSVSLETNINLIIDGLQESL